MNLLGDPPSRLNSAAVQIWASKKLVTLYRVAQKSGNLKNTYVKKIKQSVGSLLEIIDPLAGKSVIDETRAHQGEHERLKKDTGYS